MKKILKLLGKLVLIVVGGVVGLVVLALGH